ILFRQAKAKDSLEEYTTGAKYRTPSAYDLEVVASDYVVLKDYPDADKWFTKALEWNPRDALGWYYLGRTKYNENRFEEAIRAFQECLKLEPKNVKAEDNLGLSYAGLARNEDAKTAYLTAIDWQKDDAVKNAGPFVDLGSLLLDENRIAEAIPYLLQAREISPSDVQVHRELGKAYLHLDQLRKAEEELRKGIELAPEDASLHYMLGQVYRKERLNDKAKLEFDRYAGMTGTHSTPQNPDRP
ncbi:MAG: tetratricopeptide repeat protein, partial [Acidobacteriaceae bacterium]|nr:tetratricopeptide repeat protein [Acidobacteriaceae bacterium]